MNEKTNLEKATDICTELAQGNPGAMNAICELVRAKKDDAIAFLQKHGIKGPAVWICYKDFSGQDTEAMADMLDVSGDRVLEKLREMGYLS